MEKAASEPRITAWQPHNLSATMGDTLTSLLCHQEDTLSFCSSHKAPMGDTGSWMLQRSPFLIYLLFSPSMSTPTGSHRHSDAPQQGE